MLTLKRLAAAILLSLVLALSLPGCGTPSQPPPPPFVTSPRLPPPDPRLMLPPPSETYSDRVRKSLSDWANKLTDSPPK